METFLKLEALLQSNSLVFGIYFFCIGLCIASFLNVVIFRIPKIQDREDAEAVKEWLEDKGETFPAKLTPMLAPINLSLPASHCYCCKTPLKWYHNIPIVSYVFLGGKCGFCKEKISIQYPLVELFGGLAMFYLFHRYIGQGLIEFSLITTLFFMCYAMFGIDWKTYTLPDNFTLPTMWIGLVAALAGHGFDGITLEKSLYGAIGGYLLCYVIGLIAKIIFKKEALGQGDYKLIAAIGAFVGLTGAVFTFFAGALVGLIIYILRKALKISEEQTPYGPALIITAFIWILFKTSILRYISLPMF